MEKEKLTMANLFDLKSLGQPIIHGDLIFYIETQPNKDENTYYSHIYSINKITKERRRWGDAGTSQSLLTISPNGKYLAYLGNNNKDKKMQIMLMPIDGGSAYAVTDEKEGISHYVWTRNSASLYYQTTVKNDKKSNEDKKHSHATIIDKLTYKQDGSGVFPQNLTHQIKKVEIATLTKQLLLEEKREIGIAYVSHDESYLLLTDQLDSDDEWNYGETVYYYDVSSKEKRSLTTRIPKGNFSFAAMSEAEDYLLLNGNNFEYAFVSLNQVYGYDMKTHQLICLTEDLDAEVSDALVADFQQNTNGVKIEWLNDSEFLFPVTKHGKIQLYKGDRIGKTELVFDQRLHLTDGKIDKSTNQLVVTFSTLTKTSELALLNLDTGQLEVVYQPNEPFFKHHAFVEPEMFWYKGADNWDIQGWYLPPLEEKSNHPAVLYIHGGPQVAYGESFFFEMQVMAAEGYGVIMLNPRGGNGYGQAFVASILGNYGNKDFDDLMFGTDHILEQHPEINKDAVYVMGGSYGGFMTNWIVGHTNRFKAAISQRSISNWISFYGTSDVGAFFVEFQLKRDLSDMVGLWNMSPLAYASQVKTPLFLMHSEDDLRCPLEQAQQFYVAMKKNGVETKMMTFPDSDHGLSRNGLPNLRLERSEAIFDWLATH